MATKGHSERKHAILSASGSSRWMNCTPSARLEDEHGIKYDSPYADEGTTAHELGELLIKCDVLKVISEDVFNAELEELMNKKSFNEEMLEVVPSYVNYVAEQFTEAIVRTTDAVLEIEQKLDFSDYVDDGFGMGDSIIISDGILEIIDLKYGRGVPVYAMNNSQLMLYALGALRKYSLMYDIDTVRLTIIQPRINNISSWELSVDSLFEWAENFVKPTAEIAYAGRGELNPGDWCKFCSVKSKCKAIADEQLSLARHEFKSPSLMTDEDISKILALSTRLQEWVSSIHQYALEKAFRDGTTWPGYKLVRGISRRKWADEILAQRAIEERLPGLDHDDIYATKLRSITDIEKKIGKKQFAEILEDVVVKPLGAPTLVPLEDKRPAINGVEQAINDFND